MTGISRPRLSGEVRLQEGMVSHHKPQAYLEVEAKLGYLSNRLLGWSADNTRILPWRNTSDAFRVCVAEILLHQTSASKVVPIYEEFIKRYPDPLRLSKARLATISRLVHPLGLHYRARKLKEMGKTVMLKHAGRFPSDSASLLSLPGVGEYTASAVMCFAYGEQIPILDTNVIRVYTRYLGLQNRLPSSSPTSETRCVAETALPQGKAREYNYALLDFASAVCTHYRPDCQGCPVGSHCVLGASGTGDHK